MISWKNMSIAAVSMLAITIPFTSTAIAEPITPAQQTATPIASSQHITDTTNASYVAQGRWGQTTWTLDTNGVLTIDGRRSPYAEGTPGWTDSKYVTQITHVHTLGTVKVYGYTVSLFENALNLECIDGLANWDMSNVNNTDFMFYNCPKLTNIDALANWDMSHVDYMRFMFHECTSLTDASAIAHWTFSDYALIHGLDRLFCEHVPLRTIGIPAAQSGGTRFVQQASRAGLTEAMHCLSPEGSSELITWEQLAADMAAHPENYATGKVYHHTDHA